MTAYWSRAPGNSLPGVYLICGIFHMNFLCLVGQNIEVSVVFILEM